MYFQLATPASLYSLKVDHAKRSGQEPEELRDTDGIDSALSVDIVVVPGILVVVVEVVLTVLSALVEVGADDLSSGKSGGVLSQGEVSSWLGVSLLVGVTLNSILVEHVLGERINGVVVGVSRVSDESLGLNSGIGIFEVSIFIHSSWELVHLWVPSDPIGSLLDDLLSLNERLVVESDLSVEQVLVLIVQNDSIRDTQECSYGKFHY